MPLRGLFSKKNKSRVDVAGAEGDGTPAGELESALSSPTMEYIRPERSLPSSPNGKSTESVYPFVVNSPAASSSKLRLPFGRKKASSKSNASDGDLLRPPQFASRHSTSNASESDISEVRSERAKLGPPPSKSAIFAAYGDPNGALSTRSLPNGYRPDETAPSPPTTNNKRPSIFPWTSKSQPNTARIKNKDKEKSSTSNADDTSTAHDNSSFNLKSFRHVRAPSPPPPDPISSQTSLVPPPPLGTRSRNTSVGSLSDPNQSQQRISVAAFREAQARRSLAGSPVPSVGRARSPSPGPNSIPPLPNASSSFSTPTARPRRSSIAFGSGNTYQSSSEEDESDEEVDSDGEPVPSRKTRSKTKAKAKSELGHGTMSASSSSMYRAPAPPSTKPSSSAHLRPQKAGGNSPRAQSTLGFYNGGQTNENAGAVNASRKNITSTATQPSSSSSSSSSSESDTDSDNAPLATLVAPRRPGSAMSSSSRTSNPSAARPPVPAMPGTKSRLGPGLGGATDSDTHSHSSTGSHPTSRSGAPRAQPLSRSRANSNAMSISSNMPNKPKPLIDINTLTGPNRRPLESGGLGFGGGVHGAGNKSMEGFTGGATLLSAGTTISASGSARDSRASSPPLSSVTSTSPPTKFVSPPASPVLGERMSQQQQQQMREGSSFGVVGVKMEGDAVSLMSRSSATESSVSGSGSGATYSQDVQKQSQEKGQGRKRDMFSERLNRVVQQSVGGVGASASVPTLNTWGNLSVNVDDELVVPRTESPSPIRSPGAGAGWKGFGSGDRANEAPTPPSKSGVGASQSQAQSQPQSVSHQRKASAELALTLPSLKTFTFGKSEDTVAAVGVQHQKKKSEDSPISPIEDLASVLGAGIKLVSLNGEDQEYVESDVVAKDEGGEGPVKLAYDEELERPPSPGRIAPIPIKRRVPAPSFSVTSRPKHVKGASISVLGTSAGMTSTTTTTTTTTSVVTQNAAASFVSGSARPRSSTLVHTSGSGLGGTGVNSTWSMVSASSIPGKSGAGVSGESTASSSASSSSSTSAGASEREKEKKNSRGGKYKFTSAPLRDREREREEKEKEERARERTISNSGVGGLGLGKGVLGISKGPPPPPRQRTTSSTQRMSSIPASPNTLMFPGPVPSKPFAGSSSGSGSATGSPRGIGMGPSPASSTGGSSSGRAPITPRDGSDLGGSGSGHSARRGELEKEKGKEQWGSGVSGLSLGGKNMRGRSVAFDEPDVAGSTTGSGKSKEAVDDDDGESRRRERRRSEARAAIELGNTINGRGPILDEEEEEDLPISQTAAGARMNPMMMGGPMSMSMPNGFGPLSTGSSGWGGPWPGQMPQMPTGSSMLSPAQFMVPPPSDPAMFAAHQQAMMIAKQAYQMAVAQQAMAMAAEEWERGSAVGFSSSQSMYGGPAPSVMGSTFGGMGMGMGMGMGGGSGWSGGSEIFPTGPRSAYGAARSEYGGGSGGGWGSSRSVYGESFGPSATNRVSRPSLPSSGQGQRMSSYSRDSGHYPPMPPVPQGHKNAGTSSRQAGNPRARTVSQPATPRRSSPGPAQRRAAPPSSWKASGM